MPRVSAPPAPIRPLLFLLALLSLCALPAYANVPAPLVHSAQFYLYDQQTISVSEGQLTSLQINFSIPLDSTVAQAPASATRQADAEGNPYLQIDESHPQMPYTYSVKTTLSTQAQSIDSLPSQWTTPPLSQAYLQSTAQVPAADPAIRRLAESITANATTPFEQIAALAQWTHDYIQYDSSLVGQEPSASTILSQRRGVCTEYSTLFATLARSLGYPTRFVNGYAYADDYDAWLGHAWTEVYIGRWVSVDPTWLEVGALDATHIVSSRQAVRDFKGVSISAMIRSASSSQLLCDNASCAQPRGAQADNVHLISETLDTPDSGYQLAASAPRLPPGGKFIAFLRYPARDYRVLPSSLTPCRNDNGPPILSLEGGEQRLTTAPNQSFYALWSGQAATRLDARVRYTCPLTLNSEYLQERALNLNITTADEVYWPSLQADVQQPRLPAGQMQTVFVRLPNRMAGHPVTLIENQMLLTSTIGPDGRATLQFQPTTPGLHSLYVFSDAGDPVAISYEVGPSTGVLISNAHAQQLPMQGEDNQLLLDWAAPASSSTAGWTLQWSWDGQRGQADLSAGPGALALPFNPGSAGDFTLTMRILDSSGQELYRQSMPLSALPSGDAAIDSVQLMPSPAPGLWQALAQVSSNGTLSDLRLHLDGRVVDVPANGQVELQLVPGLYNALLTWSDAAGQAHEKSFAIDASATPPQNTDLFPGLSLPPALYEPVRPFVANLWLMGAALLLILGLATLVWFFRKPPSSSKGFA